MQSDKKLTVEKGTYGSYERPVIYLNYNNYGEIPTFEIIGTNIDVEIFEQIARAQAHGYEIEFKGFDKYK